MVRKAFLRLEDDTQERLGNIADKLNSNYPLDDQKVLSECKKLISDHRKRLFDDIRIKENIMIVWFKADNHTRKKSRMIVALFYIVGFSILGATGLITFGQIVFNSVLAFVIFLLTALVIALVFGVIMWSHKNLVNLHTEEKEDTEPD